MIKTVLKQNNITLLQFANDLNISRPTLDVYIKNYDNGVEINNPLFQKIFDFLFEDTTISNSEFLEKYAYVKSYYGNKETDLTTLRSKSITSAENEEDEYVAQCDKIIDLLELSTNNVRFNLEKLKDIESLLLEEMPSIDVLWAGKKVAIIKINKVEKMYLSLIMDKSEPDSFKPEEVIFYGSSKFCLLREDSSLDNLMNIAKTMEMSL